jgi:hypothetical protein
VQEEGEGVGGEMTQTLNAHMNKRNKKKDFGAIRIE